MRIIGLIFFIWGWQLLTWRLVFTYDNSNGETGRSDFFWCTSTYRRALEILHIQAKIAMGFCSDDYDEDGDVDDDGCVEHCFHQRQPAHRLAVIEIGNCLSNAFVFRLCASDFGNLAIVAILVKSSFVFQNFLLCFSVIWFRNHWKKRYSLFHIQLWKKQAFFLHITVTEWLSTRCKSFFSSKKWHRPWCLGKIEGCHLLNINIKLILILNIESNTHLFFVSSNPIKIVVFCWQCW